jgi:hypothetical protein
MRAVATRYFAILLPALVLAACGEVRWVKPGGDGLSVTNDLAACRATAHSSAQRMYGPQQPSTGHPFLGTSPDPSPADRQMREQEAVNRCMRDKGYALVPVER